MPRTSKAAAAQAQRDAAIALIDQQVKLVVNELMEAERHYPSFHSPHEGYAVLLEEVRELEAEVFKGPRYRTRKAMQHEAIQVAAMAVRFLLCLARG